MVIFSFCFFCCCLFERELETPARPLEQMQTIRLMTFNNELSNLTLIVVTGDFIKRAAGVEKKTGDNASYAIY